MININELGLPDESLITDHLDTSYPTHRQKIRTIISISLGICIIILILSPIFIYFLINKQQLSLNIDEKIKSNNRTIEILDQPNVRVGTRFGDITGYEFDDSLIEKFTSSHYVRGIKFRPNISPLNWFQCFYSSADRPESMIEGDIHGIYENNDSVTQFFLDKNEKISKIQVKVDVVQLYADGVPSLRTHLIMAMRFYTTKGRISPAIDHFKGQMYSEEFDGYYLGYVTGKSGRYIDQIQFHWYKIF